MKKGITALLLGYACAAAWVVYADVVYHNNVPLEAFEFHGLYPISLGLSAIAAALFFDRNLKSLFLRSFKLKYLFIPVLVAAFLIGIPFIINLLLGISMVNPAPKVDMELIAIGIPVLIILSLGEELMWRGVLLSEFSKRYDFITTSILIGVLWALWHYPVIIHTKFLYADRPLAFALLMITLTTLSLSFLYNYLRVASNSIWPCVFLHAFSNYFAFTMVEPFEKGATENAVYFINDIGIFYVLTSMAAGYWGFRMYRSCLGPHFKLLKKVKVSFNPCVATRFGHKLR